MESLTDQAREIGRLRAALVRICELIEEGWSLDEIHHHAEAAAELPVSRPYRCGVCGFAFQWPGELDHHSRFSHWNVDGHDWRDDDPDPEPHDKAVWANLMLDEVRERDDEERRHAA